MVTAIPLADLQAAAQRIAPAAVRTPLLTNARLDAVCGAQIFLKPENLQRTGSFKFRGAYNRLAQLKRGDKVVAFSSGNHAQGVAAAAQLLSIEATIVMPHDAPAVKRQMTEAYGAHVVGYDRDNEDREAISACLAQEQGAVLVSSYDDLDIMTGQGTAGLEIASQAEAQGGPLDILFVCCGGGGLISGVASALAHLSPATHIYSVEPEGFDDTARSLSAGKILRNAPGNRSICDAILTPQPGNLTFPVNAALLAGGVAVSDDEVKAAMRFAFDALKLVVEPGGAVALAAVLANKVPSARKRVGAVLSGGNVDSALFAAILNDT